jgi:hypothetical protein
MRSFDEPCGSWAGRAVLAQPGACSNSIGPRISAWQLVHSSFTELPTLRFLTLLIDPCGLVTRQQVHLAFANRHVGDSSLGLHDLLPVTRDAHLGFGCLYH